MNHTLAGLRPSPSKTGRNQSHQTQESISLLPQNDDNSSITTVLPSKGKTVGGSSAVPTKLLVKSDEARLLLGGISSRTLARLEKRGLLRSTGLLRHKTFAMSDLVALVETLKSWGSAS